MRLLYITYKVNPRDSLVGYVVGWINGLAARMERVEVICLAAGQADLAPNVRVHSLGKERGAGRFARAINFYRALWRVRSQVDAVFCQFSPEYVLAAAPLAKLKRWPIVLWYTHRHVGWRLRLAAALADRIVSASPESFQLSTPKLRLIGHGIDVARFRQAANSIPDRPLVLAVGRLSPIKNYELLIEAAQILVRGGGADIHVRIVGGDEGNAPPGYAAQLQARIHGAGLSEVVTLAGAVPYDEIPDEFARATVAVNLCPTGGLDKAVLESMAAGVPTLVCNEAFRPLLGPLAGDLMAPADARAVATKIEQLLRLPAGERRVLGERLRRIVNDGFSQKAFIRKLGDVLAELND